MDYTRRTLLVGTGLIGAAAIAGFLPGRCAPQGGRKPMAQEPPPVRPPGQPKPLLDEDIAPVLARLDAWYAAHLPPDRYKFNPPATEAQVDAFERLIGFKLPRSYHQLYRWHDGENDDRWGHVYGLPLLPLEWAASEWKSWNKILAEFKGNRYEI